jgi:hypothetical protein
MKKIGFTTRFVDGDESVMPIAANINVNEVRFNRKSREITICYSEKPKYKLAEVDKLSWQALKKLVLDEGGTWTDSKDAIEFLTK